MHVKKIHLVNYRGIEDLTVEFEAGVNLIIGNNGAGKSSLLGGISFALESLLWGMGTDKRQITKNEIRAVPVLVGSITESVKYYTPVRISSILELDGIDYETSFEYDENLKGDIAAQQFNSINKMQELVNDENSRLPLLSYLGDSRQFFTVTNEPDRPSGQIERRQGYKDCLNGRASVELIQNWCAQMDYAGYRLGHDAVEYVLFKNIVSRFIMELEGLDKARVEFSPKLNRLVYSENEGGGSLVHNLSAGYQSVLCLVMELAYRTALLNPSLDSLENLEGVVLIDEIDMHLHPRWQWKILGALRATFPKVQFIIATHSPIVISSAEDSKLILMENPNKIRELPDAYGYNIGDVLELTQGSMDMPQEVKEWRREIEQALDNNDLAGAERIIQISADKMGEESSAVKRMRDFLEVNKWIAED